MAAKERLYGKLGRPPGKHLVTRDVLLRAGLEVFAKLGYDAASTRAIVDEAGVALPSLYHHFGNKAGLYEAALEFAHEAVIEQFELAAAQEPHLEDKVVAILRASADFQEQEPTLVEVIVSAPLEVSRNPELKPAAQHMVRLLKFFDSLCDEAAPRGADPRQLSRAIQTLIYGIGRMGATLSPKEFREVIDADIKLVRGELFAPARRTADMDV